jgi:hypothetical protein
MKKLSLIILAVFAVSTTAFAGIGGYIQLITPSTNFNYAVGADGTNAASNNAYTNNVESGALAAAGNQQYTLNGGLGSQPSTNLWPSAGFSLIGYPNTYYGPNRYVAFYFGSQLMSTSVVASIQCYFAGSLDNSYWVSNIFSLSITNVNSVSNCNPILTNIDCGAWQYIAVQQITNLTGSTATNMVLEVGGKPGL